eukprot:356118-Chlamydomonas_euryale.AAC.14
MAGCRLTAPPPAAAQTGRLTPGASRTSSLHVYQVRMRGQLAQWVWGVNDACVGDTGDSGAAGQQLTRVPGEDARALGVQRQGVHGRVGMSGGRRARAHASARVSAVRRSARRVWWQGRAWCAIPTPQSHQPWPVHHGCGCAQIHSATLESGVLDNADVLSELARLKAERGWRLGLSVSGPRQADVIRRALKIEVPGDRGGMLLFDCVQATWNVMEQSAGKWQAKGGGRADEQGAAFMTVHGC